MIKHLSKPASLGAIAALALSAFAADVSAQAADPGYVNDTRGGVVKSPYSLCYRSGSWSPAAANAECDPELVPKPAAPMPSPRREVAPEPAPAPAPVPLRPAPAPAPKPVTEKVTMSADALFDFDKAVVKPDAKAKLDDLVGKLREVNLEVVIAVGHTDSIGTDAYNMKLSNRRAAAIKSYLVSKGIPANRVYTEGKGERQPVASNKTRDGRAKNRRVEVEVVGTRTTNQ